MKVTLRDECDRERARDRESERTRERASEQKRESARERERETERERAGGARILVALKPRTPHC
jgi:hypothetical protein